MSDELDKKIAEYAEKFNDVFPIYQAPDNEEAIIAIIDNALKTGKPYEPEVEEGILY